MMATKRLKKELLMLQREPVPLAVALPLEKNILEWRFLIQGIGPYAGGYYHGKLVFPPEYPLKPPSILFFTPSGRFATNTRICMSISDFHPESWAPSWTVGTILTGIVSFFNAEEMTVGAVAGTEVERRQYAAASLAFNAKDKVFVKLFGSDMSEHFPPPPPSSAPAAASSSEGATASSTSAPEDQEALPPSAEVAQLTVDVPPPAPTAAIAIGNPQPASTGGATSLFARLVGGGNKKK